MMNNTSDAPAPFAAAKGSAFRWKPMDVAYADNIHRPRVLVLEVNPKYPRNPYTVCGQCGGTSSHSDHSLRTREEWLEWVDRFADDLTGRELRKAKESVRAPFEEPDYWRHFRERYAATGAPWLPETPNDPSSATAKDNHE